MSYVDDILARVKAQNPDQPEFNQAVYEVLESLRAVREQVRQEILDGTYKLDADVKISLLVDFQYIYNVGEGHLTHNREGFKLTGCDGRLNYTQKPQACYGLYADYYWYEIADVICIGDNETLYYCFPQGSGDVVAKTRLAVEEMYKLYKERKLVATATDKKIPNND